MATRQLIVDCIIVARLLLSKNDWIQIREYQHISIKNDDDDDDDDSF